MNKTNISIEHQKRIQIKCLLEIGMSPTEISRHLKCSQQTVYSMKKRTNIERKKRVSWHTKLYKNTKKSITRFMKEEQGASIRKCTAMLNMSSSFQKNNKTINQITVYRYVK